MIYLAMLRRRLKDERERRGLSQEEMAGLANTSQAQISLVETGTRMPTVGTLLNYATALKCELYIDLVRDPRHQS